MDCIYKLSRELCIPKVLVGNKVDLADDGAQRQVLKSEALKVAQEHEIEYIETSAKEDVNIKELMAHIFKQVFDQQKKKRAQEDEDE
jgi:GTPase SAR1 family protein